jgi:hypothetical protein
MPAAAARQARAVEILPWPWSISEKTVTAGNYPRIAFSIQSSNFVAATSQPSALPGNAAANTVIDLTYDR